MNSYVYEHIRKDTGLPFYVGKGTGRRAFVTGKLRSNWWNNVVNKAGGRSVRIVVSGIDEEFACFIESELIDKYRRIGLELVNMTLGGEAGSRLIDEIETRRLQKMKAAQSTPEAKKLRSVLSKKMWSDPETKARIRNSISRAFQRPESKAKKSAASKAVANKLYARRVLCLSNGVSFGSLADAAEWVRNSTEFKATASKICLACQGSRKTAYGFKWQYI